MLPKNICAFKPLYVSEVPDDGVFVIVDVGTLFIGNIETVT